MCVSAYRYYTTAGHTNNSSTPPHCGDYHYCSVGGTVMSYVSSVCCGGRRAISYMGPPGATREPPSRVAGKYCKDPTVQYTCTRVGKKYACVDALKKIAYSP